MQCELHQSFLLFFICQCFKQGCWSVATTEASSHYFTEILSITERKTARASHICLVKIRNGPICSNLIRTLRAETAIIFLSLGFSCGPVVLQCPHTKSRAHLERGDVIQVWHIFLQLLYTRMVKRSKKNSTAWGLLNIALCRNSSKIWGLFSLLYLIWLMLRQIWLPCASTIC